VYGDGDPHIENSLARFAARAAHDPLPVVHHADVAQGVQRAITAPLHPGYSAYNIAGDGAATTFELFQLIGRSFDLTAAEGRSASDPWFGFPDTTRAYRELGFRPIYPTAQAAWRDGAL
jgi:nucleoside-diphosphate-sugar epimerase